MRESALAVLHLHTRASCKACACMHPLVLATAQMVPRRPKPTAAPHTQLAARASPTFPLRQSQIFLSTRYALKVMQNMKARVTQPSQISTVPGEMICDCTEWAAGWMGGGADGGEWGWGCQ